MSHHITVYGSSWSDCKRAKRFLGDQQVEYKWVDVEQDEEARTFVEHRRGAERLLALRRLHVHVKKFLGSKHLEGVVVFIGLKPNTDFLKGTVALTKEGFIDAPDFHTSLKGVFAAGDARAGSTKQVASAVGEGAAAALAVRHDLEQIGEARHVEVEMMPA